MSGFKGKDSKSKKEIDFNDQSFESIVKDTVNSKLKNGPKNPASTAIAWVTSRPKLVASLAGYFIFTGVIANITVIYKGVKFLINLI